MSGGSGGDVSLDQNHPLDGGHGLKVDGDDERRSGRCISAFTRVCMGRRRRKGRKRGMIRRRTKEEDEKRGRKAKKDRKKTVQSHFSYNVIYRDVFVRRQSNCNRLLFAFFLSFLSNEYVCPP